MEQYHYEPKDLSPLLDTLNELGEEGWLFYKVIEIEGTKFLVFRRKKDQET